MFDLGTVPRPAKVYFRIWERFSRRWVARSLLVGLGAALCDVLVLLSGVELLGLPRVPSVTAGVVTGATVGFLLNKYFAFRDRGQLAGQAVRYGLLVSAEVMLHTALTATLVHWAGWHYLPSKFSADLLVFTVLHLLALRYLVFLKGDPLPASPAPAREREAG